MKIDKLPPSLRRNRGFTLIELVVAMGIGTILFAVIVHLLGTFFGGAQILQGMLINTRYQIDGIGQDVERETQRGGKVFYFAGRLTRTDGSDYAGGELILNQPISEIWDETGFLSASGLTQTITAGADQESVLWVNDPKTPVWLYRESHELTDDTGGTLVSLSYAGAGVTLRSSFVVPQGTAADRLEAAKGAFASDGEGRIEVVLPNPLALSAVKLPEITAGMRIEFRSLRYRLKP